VHAKASAVLHVWYAWRHDEIRIHGVASSVAAAAPGVTADIRGLEDTLFLRRLRIVRYTCRDHYVSIGN
jgi:hypothetical protein